jgi:glycine/D-amino acid oxidase-like deaminating enzyme
MHDVIVVGGGGGGATVAYLCAREGLKTLLVDRTDAGRATDAGAGIISPGTSTRNETLFDLTTSGPRTQDVAGGWPRREATRRTCPGRGPRGNPGRRLVRA